MRIVSFNVNSVRKRLPQLRALVDKHAPDIIGLQETKVSDSEFPVRELESLGYHIEYHGQKTHYGVALLSKLEPSRVYKGFEHDEMDAQRRWIGIDINTGGGTETVYNGYFPQGDNRANPLKFPAKSKFYRDVLAQLCDAHKPTDHVVVMGDFNVAPTDLDIGIGPDNAKRWLKAGKASFLPEERDWLQSLFDWGLVDTFRFIHPEQSNRFSWFDYRSRGFEREPRRGLRIDLILVSQPLAERLTAAGSDYGIRAMKQPSDHCPVWSEWQHD